MADWTYDKQLDGSRDYVLRLEIDLTSQDIAGNDSTFAWALKCIDVGGSGSWANYASGWSISIGSGASGTIPATPVGSFTIASGSKTVAHSADGTLALSVSGYWDSDHSNIGKGTASGTVTPPRIPRGPRVRVSGVWKNTVAYVRTGGVWKVAVPYVRSSGTWKVGGG